MSRKPREPYDLSINKDEISSGILKAPTNSNSSHGIFFPNFTFSTLPFFFFVIWIEILWYDREKKLPFFSIGHLHVKFFDFGISIIDPLRNAFKWTKFIMADWKSFKLLKIIDSPIVVQVKHKKKSNYFSIANSLPCNNKKPNF